MTFKRFSIPVLLIVLLSLSPVASVSASFLKQETKKPLTNADIIRMVKENFKDDEIIDQIQMSETQFDLSVDALIQLRDAGVSEKVREAMRAAEKRKRAPSQSASDSQGANQSAVTNQPSPPKPPYAFLVAGEVKQNLPVGMTQIAQAKAKSNDLASLAADAAVDSVLTQAAATAAVHAAIASGAIASVPILGAVVGLLPGILRRKPTVTYLWALPGENSSMQPQTNTPKFELFYGDIPGVDPDEYQPALVKLEQTRNNWRLVGATRAKVDVYQSATPDWEVYSSFVERTLPTRLNKLGRGHVQVEPETPLEPGEYGVVLRPISKAKKFSGTDVASGQREGLLFNSVWDFSVSTKSAAQ